MTASHGEGLSKQQEPEIVSVTGSSAPAVPHKSTKREIDDLFKQAGTKKRRVTSQEDLKATPTQVQQTKATAKLSGSKEDLFGTGSSKLRRRDDEGLPIYSTEELKVGKGGETGECPFDCSCCF